MAIGITETEWGAIYSLGPWLGSWVKVTLQDGTLLIGRFEAAVPLVKVLLSNCVQIVVGSVAPPMFLGSVPVSMQNVLSIDVIVKD